MSSERVNLLTEAHQQVYDVADSIRVIAEREFNYDTDLFNLRADNLNHAAEQFGKVGQTRTRQRKSCCQKKMLIIIGVLVLIVILIIIIIFATG